MGTRRNAFSNLSKAIQQLKVFRWWFQFYEVFS